VQRAQLRPRLRPERVHVPLDDPPLRQVRPLPGPHRAGGRLLGDRHRLRRLCHRSECDGARDRENRMAPADSLVRAIHPLELPFAEQRSPGPETVRQNSILRVGKNTAGKTHTLEVLHEMFEPSDKASSRRGKYEIARVPSDNEDR